MLWVIIGLLIGEGGRIHANRTGEDIKYSFTTMVMLCLLWPLGIATNLFIMIKGGDDDSSAD